MRQTVTLKAVFRKCHAPDEVFLSNYNDVPKEYKEIIEKQQGLGCCGDAIPGHWCNRPTRKCFWYTEDEQVPHGE